MSDLREDMEREIRINNALQGAMDWGIRAGEAERSLAAAQERIAELEAALERVSRWHHSGIVHMSETRPLAPFELVPIEECRREPCVIARAALAVSQGGGGGEEVAPASATDDEPWCTVDRHIVLPSGEACVCGENRMELML